MPIRPARADDLPRLQQIEVAAGAAFVEVGMPEIAADAPPSIDELTAHLGLAWVATDDDVPIAYLIASVVDGDLHVDQVSVHADASRRGLGRALIDEAERTAVQLGLPALTLTTFRDVPWNAPYYARLGFTELLDADLRSGLRAVRAHDAAIGLDRWPRVAMRRPVA